MAATTVKQDREQRERVEAGRAAIQSTVPTKRLEVGTQITYARKPIDVSYTGVVTSYEPYDGPDVAYYVVENARLGRTHYVPHSEVREVLW